MNKDQGVEEWKTDDKVVQMLRSLSRVEGRITTKDPNLTTRELTNPVTTKTPVTLLEVPGKRG